MRSLLNLIKQYSGEIHPAPEIILKSQKSAAAEADEEKAAPKEDLTQQAQTILDMAFSQAEQILGSAQERSMAQMQESMEKAQQECENLRKQGHEEGFSQGLEDGKQQGHEQGWQEGLTAGTKMAQDANSAVLKELQTLLETVEQQRETVLQQHEDGLCTLAVSVAEKILKRELELDKDSIRTILINALDSYRNQAWIRINVSPETAKNLLHTNGTIADALQDVSENVKVVSSPQMSNADCVVELPDQVIDAGVDAQLHKVEQALTV